MTTLRIDLETFSSVDLRKAGMHRYVESIDFEVMLLAYAFDAEPVQVIDLMQGESIPPEVETAIFDPDVIKTAYNAAFELACLGKHFGRALDPMEWRCTSVHALYLGLPGNLADVGKVIGLPEDQQKKRSGGALIRYFCIPCKPTKANGMRKRNKPLHDREKWRLFKDYCAGDVVAEREIANRLAKFPVPDKEQRLWVLDQKMNNKGVTIDRYLVEAAIQCDQIYKQRLMNEAIALTGLSNPNSRNQLLAWLVVEDGTDVEDLTKKTVPAILKNTESDVVRRVMELRQQLAKTSVSKYHAMERSACADAAVRGLTQFYGANRTGRWAGRLVQVQNLPQNKHKDIDLARNLMKAGDFDGVDSLFGNVFDTLSQLIRTAFVARPGHKFVIVDFSAIEARVVAWLAWCQWRIDVFNTHGKIYEASAEQMFKLPKGSVDKKSPYRQKGKLSELALGYAGGAGALKTMGALDMGLTEDELEPIKVAWREANPEIVQLWYDCDNAAKEAVARKTSIDVPIAGGRSKLTFVWESGFLFITLPSGRRLAYVKPRIEAEDLYREKADGSKFQIARAGSLTYEGLDQKTKQWTRLSTYGGKLCIAENTLVLTLDGWIPIQYVTPVHVIWDGIEWVSQDGAVFNGVKEVVKAYGAWMTPDHEVLSEGGWIHASQSERHNRASCRLPHGFGIPRQRWEKIAVESCLRLRQYDNPASGRNAKAVEPRNSRFMRLSKKANHKQTAYKTRNESSPGFCSMEVYARSLQTAFASGLAKLRGARHTCLRSMAKSFREFLGGYGAGVQGWAYVGSHQQRRELHAEKLSLGDLQRASKQPQKSKKEKVYDLVNCGPRHRFVIWAGGAPLIVHNCENITQAIARDLLAESMLALDDEGFNLLTTVHDEIVAEEEIDGSRDVHLAEQIMGRPIPWAKDLPLRGDGFETPYYMKEID